MISYCLIDDCLLAIPAALILKLGKVIFDIACYMGCEIPSLCYSCHAPFIWSFWSLSHSKFFYLHCLSSGLTPEIEPLLLKLTFLALSLWHLFVFVRVDMKIREVLYLNCTFWSVRLGSAYCCFTCRHHMLFWKTFTLQCTLHMYIVSCQKGIDANYLKLIEQPFHMLLLCFCTPHRSSKSSSVEVDTSIANDTSGSVTDM